MLVKQFVSGFVIVAIAMLAAIAPVKSAFLDLDLTEPAVTTFTNGNRIVRFVEMQHVAKPEFYQSVKALVISSKTEGFVLFYEFIDFYELDDFGQRKVRKAVGFLPMPDIYGTIFEADTDDSIVVQNNDLFLGLVNNLDFNVDLSAQEFLAAVENRFGTIKLDSSDHNTPIDEFAPKPLTLPGLQDIVIEHRNELLARATAQSEYEKTIILYGAAHREGFFDAISRLEKGWTIRADNEDL